MPDLTPQIERELAEMEALLGPDLRAERPAPADDWVRRMDRLMELEFPASERPRAARVRGRGRRWAQLLLTGPALGTAAAAVLAALVIAASLAGGGDSDEMAASGGGSATEELAQSQSGGGRESASAGAAADSAALQSDEQAERSADAEESAGVAPDAQSTSPAEPLPLVPPGQGDGSPQSDSRDNRRVERSAAITLGVRPAQIDGVARQVSNLADAQQGFVVTSSVASSRSRGGGTLTLRVPEPNLDATMAELARLGAVRDRSQRTEDITAQTVSARDRLQDARAERRSLLRQLEDATTLQATAALRARLRDVSAEIESARAAVRRVTNRSAFATVTVALVADAAAAPAGEDDDGAWGPGDAARDALRVLEVVAGVALVALAVLLPLALVVALLLLAARWGTRRGRERALDLA
jgi:hypothetical protein